MSTLPKIEWNDAFSIGIPSVDFEHRELITLVNKVIGKVSESISPDEIVAALGELFAQISAHFALEETIMRRENYSDYIDHKEDHEFLLDEIRTIMDAYEARENNENPVDFINKLNDWFIRHFKTKDSKLHSLLNHKK
jgi:hemerythrin